MEKSLEQRIEEAIREEISIIPYNPEWPNLYETEAAILRYRLPESIVIRIEHFGSTAVLGLSAKPIIDVLVQVSSLEKTREEIVPILKVRAMTIFGVRTFHPRTHGSLKEMPREDARIIFTWWKETQDFGSASILGII